MTTDEILNPKGSKAFRYFWVAIGNRHLDRPSRNAAVHSGTSAVLYFVVTNLLLLCGRKLCASLIRRISVGRLTRTRKASTKGWNTNACVVCALASGSALTTSTNPIPKVN